MRYKIVKKSYIYDDKVYNSYYIMYEKKTWWSKKPVWKYCREEDSDSLIGNRVFRDSLQKAEEWVKLQIRKEMGEFDPEDIKIYECRDSKLNSILNDESNKRYRSN